MIYIKLRVIERFKLFFLLKVHILLKKRQNILDAKLFLNIISLKILFPIK